MNHLKPEIVFHAAQTLQGVVNRTPVHTSRKLNELTGHEIYFKCENFQRVGAFKFRGAYNAISSLEAKQRQAGVITHSSGNHAQGLALAAGLLGVQATIVMPVDAPSVKRRATAGYGAKIVPCKAIEREEITDRLIEEHGYTLIHPYDDKQIIAGQGTAALELFQEVGPLEMLFVPVGGGGLISGCALAAAAVAPECRIIGVEPELAADAQGSWQAGEIITLDSVPRTIADGLRPRHIGQLNLDTIQSHVADMITVSEHEIVAALKFIWSRLKLVVEPSAAVALAPLLAGRYSGRRQRLGILLSGGNVDWQSLALQLQNYS